MPGIQQHNVEIQKNAVSWSRKALLRAIYGDFYEEIKKRLRRTGPGLVVEIGSGIGIVRNHIQDCVMTDLFANPWIDRVENAYALSFDDASISNLILLDVWHHLQYPGTALREFRRVLADNGRLIVFEPAISVTGRFVYGVLHHEPVRMRSPIEWYAPDGVDPRSAGYFSAQSYASRIFGGAQIPDALKDWLKEEVAYYASFAYWGSGGFSGPQLYPTRLLPAIRRLDRFLGLFPSVFAGRMLIVLVKKPDRSSQLESPKTSVC